MKPHEWRRTPAGKYLRRLPRLKHLRGTWLHRRLGDRLLAQELWQPDRRRVAAALGIGFFCGLLPVPLQTIPSVFLAWLARANLPVAIAAVWITNPVTTPLIVLIQYFVGSWALGSPAKHFPGSQQDLIALAKAAPLEILTGSMITAVVFGTVGFFVGGWLFDAVTSLIRARNGSSPLGYAMKK